MEKPIANAALSEADALTHPCIPSREGTYNYSSRGGLLLCCKSPLERGVPKGRGVLFPKEMYKKDSVYCLDLLSPVNRYSILVVQTMTKKSSIYYKKIIFCTIVTRFLKFYYR